MPSSITPRSLVDHREYCFPLWIGRHVEDIYGWKEFLAYYLCSGLLAGIAFVAINAIAGQANNAQIVEIAWAGPGGSITAVLFLFALHYPRRTFFYYIPVWAFVGFYVIRDTFNATSGRLPLGVFARPQRGSGFVRSALLPVLAAREQLAAGAALAGLGPTTHRPKLQIYRDRAPDDAPTPSTGSSKHPQPIAVTAPTGSEGTDPDMNEHLEAKLDQVLEKVKKHGQDSLTKTVPELRLAPPWSVVP